MSLFEKLNNKRYDLQERRKKSFPSGSFDPANQEGKFVENERNKNIESGRTTYSKNKKFNQGISQRRSAETTRGDAINRALGGGSSTEGTGGANTGTATYKPPSKKKVKEIMNRSTLKKVKRGQGVSQAEVSKRAQEFTKEINKKNKNRTFFDPEKAKEARKNLIAKRKEYGIDRKGNISDAGVKRYAQKTKQLSSGSNVPAKVTAKDLKVAKVRAVGGEKITNNAGKVIGTTTGKYGGRLGRARNKNMKTYDQIKKDIDLKNLQKASDAKARKIARSQELKDLTKKMGEKELYQKVTQQAKLKQMRPQRRFYKGVMGPARSITKAFGGKQVAPVFKKFAKVAAVAPAPVKVASVAALPLLSPGVRRSIKPGFNKIASGALTIAGIKALKSKPPKPESFDIGINLSSGKGSSKRSNFALKRQELLKTNPKKVPNKNLA